MNPEENRFSLSLIYPDEKMRADTSKRDGISESVASQLQIYDILNLRHSYAGAFFTDDAQTIRYRQKTFADMINVPELSEILNRMLPYLTDITELRQMGECADSADDSYLYSISEIEIYVSLMDYLKGELLPLREKLSSPAMIAFCDRIKELCEGEYYKGLTEHLSELASRVRDIRSITVGINLDRKMTVESAGVLSVNGEKFKSGDFFEKVKRLDFKNDDMTCIAQLVPYFKNQPENRKIALTNSVNNAISDIFRTSVKSWKKAVQSYVLENTDFLISIIPETEFLLCGTELCKKLAHRGCKLCTPQISDDAVPHLHAKELINPLIALKTEGELVPNDIDFDENAMIYVVTGPNRGGKSVLTCGVGLAAAMAQMGLFVPAESFELTPADKILTHFPAGTEDTVEKGRLGEECARLGEIFEEVSEKSIVLLDESLSSTGSFEGAYIASEVLRGFSLAGCRCIFSTHLHDLAASVDKINAECASCGGVKIDNMVAEVADGSRTFRIVRKSPDGRSYAKDIAEKYGLSAEKILEKISARKN